MSYNIFIYTDNCIDGTTLVCLFRDQTEFLTVFPKSGYRLLLKRAFNSIVIKTSVPEGDASVLKASPSPAEERDEVIGAVSCQFCYLVF